LRFIISDLETKTVIMIVLILIASALGIGIAIGLSYAEVINPQPYATSTISWIAAGIGVITLFWGLGKSALESLGKPRLEYGGRSTKSYGHETYNGRYSYINYLLEIKNKAHGIEAEDCKATLSVSNTQIDRQYIVWESGEISIPIGHDELLKLFTVREFYLDNKLDSKKILFHINEIEYAEVDNKSIIVKIQSKNAQCPSKAYSAKIKDVIATSRSQS
jgi:hypothetical protein